MDLYIESMGFLEIHRCKGGGGVPQCRGECAASCASAITRTCHAGARKGGFFCERENVVDVELFFSNPRYIYIYIRDDKLLPSYMIPGGFFWLPWESQDFF